MEKLEALKKKERAMSRHIGMFGETVDVNDPDSVLSMEKYVAAMRLGQLKQMREKTLSKTKSSSTLKKSKGRY